VEQPAPDDAPAAVLAPTREELETELAAARQSLREVERQLAYVRTSFSWRITAPVRALVRRLGGTTADTFLDN
jgi:hypothetical protein